MNNAWGRSLLVWIAGGALLVAMVTDTLAMLGRALHWPLVGSIEIVQAAVLFGACGALIVAARERAHARVHLLLDRLPDASRAIAQRLHDLFSAAVYAALLGGSLWLAIDLWSGHEESELLRIPYRPLRLAASLTLAWLLLTALLSALRPGEKR